MEQYEAKVTAIMREADQLFQKTGGSTRHYVRDLLLPMMEQAGLKIVDATPSPAKAEQEGLRWVKASEALPKNLGDPEIHYRIDGFHKVLGNFYHNEAGELVFGVIGYTHADYDIPKEKWGGLEWLDESTLAAQPDPVAFDNAMEAEINSRKWGLFGEQVWTDGANWAKNYLQQTKAQK